jgi:NADPH2:quinone reductase
VLGVASAEFWSDELGYPGRQWRELMSLIESGAIDPPIGPLFTLKDAAAAIRELHERRAADRVLIRTR